MPFKPWVRSISPLTWFLFVSAVSNALTTGAVLYLAFSREHEVWVRGGSVRAYVDQHYGDGPLKVQIAR
ncbi:hypothetical protein QCM80_38210 [Bradyrhizobium sp. SSUT112]|uniref:hypothetical protein n=1 Tax=Bradyrhizobium sp. SSUT112 TaxID=3040604 RepID=UPI0024491894|nr:hypothetical protein [Bradyrhizobium sp. SSUT112]MDH2356448.1 hypothetical protein [Bradyrhizobium sp. SSUT112]